MNGKQEIIKSRKKKTSGWRSSLAAVPGIVIALLPKLACPACWPAYAGVLSALGLGFLVNEKYLMPLTIVFLIIAVGALGFRAKSRRGYLPFMMGIIAAVIVVIGKFHFEYNPAMYAGVGLLMAASVWNAWPRKIKDNESCPECVT